MLKNILYALLVSHIVIMPTDKLSSQYTKDIEEFWKPLLQQLQGKKSPEWLHIQNDKHDHSRYSSKSRYIDKILVGHGYFGTECPEYPWHAIIIENPEYCMNDTEFTIFDSSFSQKKLINELILTPPVLFKFTKRPPRKGLQGHIPLSCTEDLFPDNRMSSNEFLLIKNPDALKILHNVPRFNAKGLLACMIRYTMKK